LNPRIEPFLGQPIFHRSPSFICSFRSSVPLVLSLLNFVPLFIFGPFNIRHQLNPVCLRFPFCLVSDYHFHAFPKLHEISYRLPLFYILSFLSIWAFEFACGRNISLFSSSLCSVTSWFLNFSNTFYQGSPPLFSLFRWIALFFGISFSKKHMAPPEPQCDPVTPPIQWSLNSSSPLLYRNSSSFLTKGQVYTCFMRKYFRVLIIPLVLNLLKRLPTFFDQLTPFCLPPFEPPGNQKHYPAPPSEFNYF